MAYVKADAWVLQQIAATGLPLVGGSVSAYITGTTTPLAMYTNSAGDGSATSFTLNSLGMPQSAGGTAIDIYLDDAYVYKFIIRDSGGSAVGPTIDPVYPSGGNGLTGTMTSMEALRASSISFDYIETVAFYEAGSTGGAKLYRSGTGTPTGSGASVIAAALAAGTFCNAAGVCYKLQTGQRITVHMFGALGDNAANDTVYVQAGIDFVEAAGGGDLFFPTGTYRIARTIGTNDRWGINVTGNNVRLVGENGATLRRYNTDISTYALAYPILLVGTPDSNVADPTENCQVEGLIFRGENTRHAVSGSAVHDFRTAIEAKNSKGLKVTKNKFTHVDSSVVFMQKPAQYDYANSVTYNTTKSYKFTFTRNEIVAESHATPGRALMHAIGTYGCDGSVISFNTFDWCDVCVASTTTYDGLDTVETDVYTPSASGWGLGTVRRTGRNTVVENNIMHNSSEHPVYLESKDDVVSNNTIFNSDQTIAVSVPAIKVNSYGATVSGNVINSFGAGIAIGAPARGVSVTGNTITIPDDASVALGAITVDSIGLSAYIDARSAYLTGYQPVSGISVSANTIIMPESAASGSTRHMAFMVRTDVSDANFPDGQMIGVSFSANTVKNYNVGVYFVGFAYRSISITGNTFAAKPFTLSGWSSGTTLNTRAVLQINRASTNQLRPVSFYGNRVYGVTYLFASDDGGGGAGTISQPWGIQSNRLDYVKNIGTADIAALSMYNKFDGNSGEGFLDRTWNGYGVNNSLYSSGSSDLRYGFHYTGAALRFYTDDAATYITL